MTRAKLALALVAAVGLVACGGTQKAAEEDKTEALQKRVEELEKQIAASPTAAPEGVSAEAEEPAEKAEPARKAPAPKRAQAPTRQAEARPAPAEERPLPPERIPAPEMEAPRREPAPPRPDPIVLPAGTELSVVLENDLGSATSREGDRVTARVERAVSEDGRIVLPGGTTLQGRVAEARESGRVEGRAFLRVSFDRIIVRGRSHELPATELSVEAPGEGHRDAKIVGGSTAAGAVIGGILGGKKGALKGAIVGAGAGGSAALIMKGKEIELPAGSRWTVRVRDTVKL